MNTTITLTITETVKSKLIMSMAKLMIAIGFKRLSEELANRWAQSLLCKVGNKRIYPFNDVRIELN